MIDLGKTRKVRNILNKSSLNPLVLITYLEPHELMDMKNAMMNCCGQKPFMALLYDLCAYIVSFAVKSEDLEEISIEEFNEKVKILKNNMQKELQKELGYEISVEKHSIRHFILAFIMFHHFFSSISS